MKLRMAKQHRLCVARSSAVLVLAYLLTIGSVLASPPHPSLSDTQIAAKMLGQQSILPDFEELRARGIGAPDDFFLRKAAASEPQRRSPIMGDFRILALLVDFSDNTASASTTFFDTLVFGTGTGTIPDYFDEISYGQIDLVTVNLPSTIGWTRAPHTYAYYVNDEHGAGSHPTNSQGLVEDAVDAIDGVIDFSQYDNDSDGYVDVLLVIHAGTGAELSGSTADIWSHKWAITPRLKDGVYISSFTIQPEFWYTPGDMTIGVYCHELCHGFGLPDLYDTDNSSRGIGKWGIMSYGSWNGTLGSSPAHPCAWSRIQMGFASSVNISSNVTQQSIGAVNTGGTIYRLWTSGTPSSECFLLENRQQVGYDAAIPGSGLLIWHIDDSKVGNDEEWYPGLPGSQHYLVALEQADGLYELDHGSGYGCASDPFPGSGNNTSFSSASSPTSNSYQNGGTLVAVTDISVSAMTMQADLVVGMAAGIEDPNDRILPNSFDLAQNYPNPFNPATVIEFNLDYGSDVQLEVYNLLAQHVKTLLNGPAESGITTVAWDATDSDGFEVASGVYFYTLTVDEETESKKMLLVR